MGSIDSVPAAFELTVVDGRARLSFNNALAGSFLSSSGAAWADIAHLELQAPRDERAPVLPDDTPWFQTRRVSLVSAIVATGIGQLQSALQACPLAGAGIHETRLWMDPVGVHMGGRIAVGNSEAPFTIRVIAKPRGDRDRRVRIDFADVRLFAPLSIPGPLCGVAVARALTAALTETGANLGSASVRVIGAAIALDPLESTLIAALVSKGWRLPNLEPAWLQSVIQANSEIRLRFESEDSATQSLDDVERGARTARLPGLDGGPVPESLAAADECLFAGDLPAAERAYRQVLAEDPRNRSARTRLLALRAATDGADAPHLGVALFSDFPAYIPAALLAATVAMSSGDTARATDLFEKVAALADECGEIEDAKLARAAAAASRSAAGRPGPAERASDGAKEISETAVPDASGQVLGLVTGSITNKTAAVYAQQEDPDLRAAALGDLLQGFERLTPERQHDAYASFGRVAESTGDLEHAEEAYWRATSIAADAARRADDLVAHARVLLSRGNLAVAVRELEEAATSNPQHVESRRALARIALDRRDLKTAANRLEEVARLLPADEIASLVDTRQHLADIYFALGEWSAARDHVELVLAQDPRRLSMLERLTVLQEQMGLHAAAVDSFDRVARSSASPRIRAEALLRQGDILREHLNDEPRAFEAYLRSSDLDPTLAPTALHLIAGYFGRGQFDEVAAVADDLLRGGALPAMEPPLRLRLAVAVTLARGDAVRGATVAELSRAPWNAATASAVLAEVAAHLSNSPPSALDPATILLEIWRTAPNGG